MGIAAARNPPKTRTMMSRAMGSAIASPVRRSARPGSVMASTMSELPPTIPVRPGATSRRSPATASSRVVTSVEAAASASRRQVRRRARRPRGTRHRPARQSGAAAGFVAPSGQHERVDDRRRRPSIAASCWFASAIAVATPASAGSTPLRARGSATRRSRPARSRISVASALSDPGTRRRAAWSARSKRFSPCTPKTARP